MKYFIAFFLISIFSKAQETNLSPHCGFDFNSYLVVETVVNNQKVMLPNMKISIVDANNKPILNTNNQFSLLKTDEVLLFSENYKIDNSRWFFPYAQECFMLLVTLDFPTQGLNVMLEDTLGIYKTQTFPIGFQNFYKLCSSENALQSRKFGPKTNLPIVVYLDKKN